MDGGDGPPPPGGAEAEAVTTFFCADGAVVQLGARPTRLQILERRSARRSAPGDALPLPADQGLCVGGSFAISATNGISPSRRINLAGFCYSTEQLFERVEDTVLQRGGEVFETHLQLKRCGAWPACAQHPNPQRQGDPPSQPLPPCDALLPPRVCWCAAAYTSR